MVSMKGTAERAGGKIRVLALAELANPEWQSVPLVGWHEARSLMDVAEVHLVTNVMNRDAMIRAGLVEGRDFTAIDMARIDRLTDAAAARLAGGDGQGWTTRMAVSLAKYAAFESRAWRRFEGDLRGGRFDIVHRLTPLSPTVPSLFARRLRGTGVPFVIGPLNGGLPWPKEFEGVRRREREWLSYFRRAHRLVPGYAATRREAAAILVGSKATLDEMPAAARDRCVYIPENGVDPGRFRCVRILSTGAVLRAAFIGRLTPYKGPDMAIEAAADLMRCGRMVLRLVGDGPQRRDLEALAARLGVSHAVSFDGNIPTADVGCALLDSDVLLFPSVREFGGAVVVEAMTAGVVPIVVDYGGPGEHVAPGTGYKIPLGPRAGIVARLREILEEICAAPEALRTAAVLAHKRAWELYSFQAKARQMLAVYEWVLGRRAKPDFGLPLGVSSPERRDAWPLPAARAALVS